MIVGIDWDDTISRDPLTFGRVITTFLEAKHMVKVVTWRKQPEGYYPDMEEVFAMWGFRVPVIFCNGRAKRDEARCDIWIDDNPAAILFDLEATPRIVDDPLEYDNDWLKLSLPPGVEPVYVQWKHLKP